MSLQSETKPKYQVRIDQASKYDWTGLVVDMTIDPPSGTTIMAKSLGELLNKIAVALTLLDNIPGQTQETETADSNGTPPPIVLSPSRKIIRP